ncbi:MAG: helix-turn-helix domain-containing protein, partial [Halomonas sp.]
MVQKQNRVEAVERALTILEAFTDQERSLSLVTLAERTGLYKSTILRLIGSLERFGYIVREGDGTYALGPSLWRLGNLFRHT